MNANWFSANKADLDNANDKVLSRVVWLSLPDC